MERKQKAEQVGSKTKDHQQKPKPKKENREWALFKVIWESKRVIGFTFSLLVADDESELVIVLVVSVDNSKAILRAVSVFFFLKGMNIEYLPKKWSVENKCCSDTVVGENVEVAEYGGV